MRPTQQPEIGYVVKMFPRLSETFILNEIREMERHGLALRIFSLKRPTQSDAQLVAGTVRAPVHYLPNRIYREPVRVVRAHIGVLFRFPRGYVRTLLHVLRGRELSSMARGLRRFCQTCCLVQEMREVRHLHAHFASDPTRLASWARMICEVPFSVTTHAKDLYAGDRIKSPGLHYKLRLARFVVTNSEHSAEDLRMAIQEPIRLVTIYNGIDLSAFPQRAKEPATPSILAVGRLVEKKGFEHLIKACGILKARGVPFRCEIIGGGALRQALEGVIQELGLSRLVRLRGQMAQSQLREHYAEATVFALPCVAAADGDRDILPNVVKEAMAIGVPVVTTHLEGIEELVTPEVSGLLVAPRNSEALAQALERLLTDETLRRRLAAEGRKVVEDRFDARTAFKRLGELLGEVTASNAEEADLCELAGLENNAHRLHHR